MDTDEHSDRDVLVIEDEPFGTPMPDTDNRICISRYRWSEFTAMRDSGSPFVLHLQKEGLVLGGNTSGLATYSDLMLNLPQYSRVLDDIESFRKGLQDIESAVHLRDSTPDFEAASIATLIRHSAILGCYLIKEPKFGRYDAVNHFCMERGLPNDIVEKFPDIYRFRMALSRLHPWPEGMTYSILTDWIERAALIIREVSHVAV